MSRLDKKRAICLLLCLGAAVVLVAGWTWARSHGATSTDNAYIRGGVTALACKKDYPVYVDETAELFDVISISAGMRGTQIFLAPGTKR